MSGISLVTMGDAYATNSTSYAGDSISLCGLLTAIDLKYSLDLGEVNSSSSTMTSKSIPE